MSYSTCILSLKLKDVKQGGQLALDDLKATAAEFVAQGMAPEAAMHKAVSEALELAQMEEAKIISTVRAAYEAKGGKKPAKAKTAAPAEPSEIEHNGTRITKINVKRGDEIVPRWSVESSENAAKRAAGKRTIGGDTLHETIERAKVAADTEREQDAQRAQDRAEREQNDAEREAKVEENRGKSLEERRADAALDKPTKMPPQAGLGNTTRREAMRNAVEQDRHIAEVQVADNAARKRDDDVMTKLRHSGYQIGLSNENIPIVKEAKEAQARIKANDYKKPEYRVYSGRDKNGSFFEITKTEFDYAQKLKEEAAAPVAAVKTAPAEKDPIAIDEESYLAQNGAARGDIGEAGLHMSSSNISEKSHQKKVDAQAIKDSALVARREELRQEYRAKIASGEIRDLTTAERTARTAEGHPDNEATQAAKRIQEKRARRADQQESLPKDDGGTGPVGTQETSDSMALTPQGILSSRDTSGLLDALDDIFNDQGKTKPARDTTDTVDRATASPDGLSNRVLLDVHGLRNIIKTDTFRDQGYSGLDVKAQRLVMKHMLGLSRDLKVIRKIVQLIPVSVMDNLARLKLSAKDALSNPAMLERAISGDLGLTISASRDVSDALIKAATLAGAVEGSGLVLSDLKGPAKDIFLTNDAIHSDHGNSRAGQDGLIVPQKASIQSESSKMDKSITSMIQDGTTADKLLAEIEAKSESADNRALAAALLKQNLKTSILMGDLKAGQTFSVGQANESNAKGGYRASDNTALLYRGEGSEQTMLHELVHAATIRALERGGLAAAQMNSLWNHIKALPNFAGEYGISNTEEFVAEAYANPRFRQMLADTPAPGAKMSLWQKLVGLVRILLGKPPVSDNALERVMTAGAALMDDNQSADNSQANQVYRQAALDRFMDGSKVVDAEGEPIVMYHGTHKSIAQFDTKRFGALLGKGTYFTADPQDAGDYAKNEGGNIVPAYLSIKNPLIVHDVLTTIPSRSELENMGHDGVILMKGDATKWAVAFEPNQIKSATGNNGNFDATNSDIRASISETLANAANDVRAMRLPSNYLVGDLFNQSGMLSWWHKTIGTMDNLARRRPEFKPVYEAAQNFIGDVSRYAVAAADLAPRLLPKLEDIKDVIGANRKKPLTAADTKAIAGPVFEGTLSWARDANGKAVKIQDLEAQAEGMTTKQKADVLLQKGIIDDQQNQAWLASPIGFYDSIINSKFAATQLKAGVVWTDAELRDQFHLTPDRIAMYREFRSSIDKSLTNLSVSEMLKMGGKDAKDMTERAMDAPNIQAAAELLRQHFIDMARMNPDRADMHLDTAKQIMNVADKGQDLMDTGYAPLSRFGKYTVYVEKDGEQIYFGMFEQQFEASKMAREMKLSNPDAQVVHGTISEEAYKLFAGVSPETIELFGSMVGLDDQADAASTEVYQSYLKLARNNRSAMKRLIHRKGIAGFNEDAGRVLAGFIYSNARLTSGNAHLGEIDEAVNAIPKQQGELKDAAVQLRDQIKNPESGGPNLGGLMFAQFLGGSIASAAVNLTQPFTMTLPFLSQWGGIGKAGSRLGSAFRDAGKALTGDAALDKALKWAADEGIVAPQEIHYLQAQAAGKGALRSGDGTKAGDARAALNNVMSKVQLGWGKLFAMAELTNRRVTFIAAYRTAVEEGIANPAKFAQDAVTQTQGVYNSGNKPKWARGAIGGLLLTFKQYSVSYLELMSRMAFAGEPGSAERKNGQKAALYMVAVLLLMGGADGLPFEKNLEDAIDGLMQRLGYNFSTKRSKQAFLTDTLGQGGADFALKGLSAMPGMPIDVAGRFGMGNLIPGTGLLTKKQSYTQDLGELVGPAGDMAKRAFSGAGKALGGDIGGAALDMAPAAVRNLAKGADMLDTGAYNDSRGYKVNDTTPAEAVMKMIGFQPNSTAAVQDAKGQALNMIGQTRMRQEEIAEKWSQGIAQRDPALIQQARDERNDWNTKNPEAPVTISMPGVIKRVKEMKQDAVNRTQKTAPKALKESVRAQLSETRS